MTTGNSVYIKLSFIKYRGSRRWHQKVKTSLINTFKKKYGGTVWHQKKKASQYMMQAKFMPLDPALPELK